MRCKVLLIALLVGTISMPIYSQEQTSHQKTMAAIQELKAQLVKPRVVKQTSGKLIRPNQQPPAPQPMLVPGKPWPNKLEPQPKPSEQYRVELPQRSVLVDVPPPVIRVQQTVPVQQAATIPPVIIVQDNGNGDPPPIPQPTPEQLERLRRVQQLAQIRYFIDSHFRVKRGIFGLGILPCVSLKPRLVTDPAVWNYYLWEAARPQLPIATIQPY